MLHFSTSTLAAFDIIVCIEHVNRSESHPLPLSVPSLQPNKADYVSLVQHRIYITKHTGSWFTRHSQLEYAAFQLNVDHWLAASKQK
jgi:hypothetical protein